MDNSQLTITRREAAPSVAGDRREARAFSNTFGHQGSDPVELSDALAQLAAQRAQLQAILDATLNGMLLLDLDGNVLVANRRYRELVVQLDLSTSESSAECLAVAADVTTDPDDTLAKLKALAADPNAELEQRFDLAGSGGAIDLYSAPVRDADGVVVGRLYVLHDVSAERDVERVKAELAATLAHELRTPLTGIIGYAELLATRELDAETRRQYLRMLSREANRLGDLVNDVLDRERLDLGWLALATEPIDLSEVVREQAEQFAGQSQRHRLEVTCIGAAAGVVADRHRVAQVIANLLSNAIKYSPEGGVVGVEVRPGAGVVRLSVRDSGLGIPAEQQARICERFFRVDSPERREIGGTGLGLAFCREIIEAHGGAFGFESAEGTGSTFWFELPTGS
jgi:two-component system sensor histidine kinase VicK